jgi:hypothetical protein
MEQPMDDAAKRLCLATHCPVILTLLWPSITYNIIFAGIVGCGCVGASDVFLRGERRSYV